MCVLFFKQREVMIETFLKLHIFQEIIFFTYFKTCIWNFKCQIAKFEKNSFWILILKIILLGGGSKFETFSGGNLEINKFIFLFFNPPNRMVHHFLFHKKRKAWTTSFSMYVKGAYAVQLMNIMCKFFEEKSTIFM